jgi:Asp-tRNA(Asn)/Glu-tRNA(Gln) amidotransferase B subunit
MPDGATIHELIRRAMADNPEVVRDYQAGRDREGAIAALVGVLTRATHGEVHPQFARRLVIAELNAERPRG